MEKKKQDELAEIAIQLFDFVVYDSMDLFESELKEVQFKIGQMNDKEMEFELLLLKTFLLDYVVSGELGFHSLEKEVVIEIYYHHFEKFLQGANQGYLSLAQRRLREYSETAMRPIENQLLVSLGVHYAKNVLKTHSQDNYEKVTIFTVSVLNDLSGRINRTIQEIK